MNDFQDIPLRDAWLADVHQTFGVLRRRNIQVSDEEIATTIIDALGDRSVGIATEIRSKYFPL